MSSTSSSECVCGECRRYSNRLVNGYGGRYKKAQRTPFYPIMGQPLVYYARVQQPVTPRQRCNENGTSNANCFVKAFRWYTKEHLPSQTSDSANTNVDMAGFASWLDTKYNEFVLDSQPNHGVYHHFKVKQTSTIEAENISNNVCEPCSTKKNTRIKRPWMKRRQTNSKEAGDVIEKSSFEYILQAEDLSHPTSECCHTTPTTCCNHSSAVSVCNNMQDSKKAAEKKSLSMTSIRQDKDNKRTVDIENVHERKKDDPIEDKGNNNENSASKTKPVENAIQLTQPNKKSTHEISCQCIEEIVGKIDAQTQCLCQETDSTENSTHKYNNGPEKKTEDSITATQIGDKKLLEIETSFIDRKQKNLMNTQSIKECTKKVDAHSQYNRGLDITQNNIRMENDRSGQRSHVKETDSFIVENLATLTKTTRSFTIFVNDVAQTSDHSISIEKDSKHQYPLFMKIVCADKLNEEY